MKHQIKIHDCRSELQNVALKATPARLATLKILETTDRPLDVATIKSRLQKNGTVIDPATIFRMMNAFSEKGLVREVNLQESKLRYEPTTRADHHHLVCEECGAIEDITDCNIGVLEKEIQEKKEFTVNHHSLEFFGLCKNCQQ